MARLISQYEKFIRFSKDLLFLLGGIFLLMPKAWFPSFYHPYYLGVLALLCPFIIDAPHFFLRIDSERKRLFHFEARAVIALAILINFGGELGLFKLSYLGYQYDKFAHFSVSFLLAFLLGEFFFVWYGDRFSQFLWKAGPLSFLAGILWEAFEALSDFLFHTQEWGMDGTHITSDTRMDIFFNLLGIATAVLLLRHAEKKAREKNL